MRGFERILACWLLLFAMPLTQAMAADDDATSGADWINDLDLPTASEDLKEWVDAVKTKALERDPGRQGLSNPEIWEDIDAAKSDFSRTLNARPGLPPVMVFVSFSMPEGSLKGWLNEAARADVPLVLRGLVDNEMMATAQAIKDLIGEDNRGSVLIDPTLFRRFNIQVVPTVVAAADAIAPCATRSCEAEPVPDHDRITGNIKLVTALRRMAAGAGSAASTARDALERME